MATRRRKAAPQTKDLTGQPPQPAWRKLSPKRRREWRRVQVAAPRPAKLPNEPNAHLLSKIRVHLTWRRRAVLIVAVAVIMGFIQLLTNRSFAVSTAGTQIRGNQRVPAEAIYVAGEIDQQNVFLLRPAAIAARISGLPRIATANVHVRLPNQVLIDVHEYTPLVAWQVMTTTTWLAANGTPVPMDDDPPPVTLVDANGAARDETGNLRPQVLANLVALHAAHPDLSAIYYGSLEGLYFRAPEGWTVYLGDDGPIASKLTLLQAIQRDLATHNAYVKTIDLRFEGQALIQ